MNKTVYRLVALFVIASLLLAGCRPAAPTPQPTKAPTKVPTQVPPEEVGGELEVFSWWTAGGEAEGLAAMLEVFQAQYPDVEVINATVAGGAGVDARAVLATRMQGGDPPGSFQVHAGHELIDTYVVANQMDPVTFLYEEEGWLDAYPADLIDILSYEGEIWSVPVNIHRANVLWYNKAVFADNNLEPPATMSDFFNVAATLKAAGVIPLALGESWTVVHLFETVLLGSLGADAYIGLWNGDTDWGSAKVTTALNNFDRMMNYVNEDYAALSWDQATQLVIDGTAAMNIMGDWAEGYFKAQGWTPGVEFGWVPSPGSGGAFDALSDSFGLPKGAPNRDAAIAWLKVCGSKEGQDAFNPIKGSIPAHTGADRSLYDEYLQTALADFASDAIVPSMMHGAAAAPSWQQDIIDAVSLFLANRDVGAFHQVLVDSAPVTASAPPEVGGELEVFSWWTAGGEAEGLAAMLEVFQARFPDVEVINATVAGGAGVDARAVLATRMQGGDPPGSFQVHAGHELIDTYVVANQMEPITFLYEEEGWLDAYPADLIDILSYNGEVWSVPVNIHRANVLWYNKAVFADNNLEPPATMIEFFNVAATLKAAGITPLALGESWTVVHLFETVLLGSLGADAYIGLWNGDTDWGSAKVTTALNNFDRMMNYVNEDYAALSWDQATQLVIDGTAAMNIMGDWAEGYFKAQGWTPGVEFGWAPSPGSGGAFDALSDSFGLPKDAPNRDAAIAWLKVCGSKEGQDAFNPIKGSIPAHTGADRSLYDEYLQSALADFASDTIVPSLMHGAAAAPSWQQDIIDAVSLFLANRDVGAFHRTLVDTAPVTASAPPEVGGELEVFSWWTAGGEAEGLAAMLEVFQAQYPDVDIINATVAGGAGVDARAVLATRMQGGDPPGSFQVHAGHELIDTYVVANQMDPVTFLYEEEGWLDAYPADLIDILSYNGEVWSVPVNIHRANVLWYNKAIFADNNLEPPATMSDFFDAAATLEAAGVIPLALGESWTVVHLFETVLLGSLGADAYIGLWNGDTDWGSGEVTTALNNFDRMMNYVNEDYAALSWDQATQLVIDGTAAMNIMGDWAEGYFKAQGWTPGVEFGWAPSPGSAGAFDALSDSFGLPKDAPNREAAIAWLKVCGSKEGQDAFNPIKGSIPAHTGADHSLYDEYLQTALADFASDAIVPSMMHGAAAAPSWQQDIIDAVSLFVGSRDVGVFQGALVAAAG